MKILNTIQQELKVPKQANKSVTYKSRSAEDIVEMVKPLLGEATLNLSDEVVMIGERYYVKATATIKHGDESEYAVAYAREDETPKFMSVAQGTGSTSSYARKYALNGLFAIDDTQDDDTREHVPASKPEANKKAFKDLPLSQQAITSISRAKDMNELDNIAKKIKESTKLSETEKASLISEVDLKAMDFEDIEVTPESVPFNQ